MAAYYNEIDSHAAAWLRELITEGLIAQGDVDERSIADVHPDDLNGYRQCHFFAGVGVWSYALRRAGWPDSRPVWTGSCPCQPFSSAGKGEGLDDDRHLWPPFRNLIRSKVPGVVLGEQVASSQIIGKVRPTHAGKDSNDWIDIVQNDMEDSQYEFGSVVASSASVGAPNIRLRTWWMGIASSERLQGCRRLKQERISQGWNPEEDGHTCEAGSDIRVVNSNINGCKERVKATERLGLRSSADAASREHGKSISSDGFWDSADWLLCWDGKYRPIKPGIEPLVDGTSRAMVRGSNQSFPINANDSSEAVSMRLRGYGNAINAEAARTFIECAMEILK